ncbi:hypothetical protein CC79DRAFT_1048888 [Sarocladium strictum]
MLDNITFGPIRTVLNTEYATASDNTKWKRKINKDGTHTVWEAISPPLQPQESPSPLALMLVLESQAEGEPKHWSLFVSREGEEGSVFQVKGDATFMTYTHIRDIDLLSSDDYYTSYTLAYLSENGEAVVKGHAEAQPPPQAANRRLVTENCQGWTVRVMQSLQLAGVIEDKWVHLAKELQEAV